MILAVEGMDGVGKSAIARYISEKYNYRFMEKPLQYFYNDGPENQYNDLMTVSNRLYEIDDNVIKTWFFALGNIYAVRMFKDEDIVFDRHLVSIYYWNGDSKNEPIYDVLVNMLGVPDLTILLYATPETRMKRIRNRDENDPDLFDPDKLDDGKEKMLYFLNKYNMPYVVIDTENKNLDEVKSEIDEVMSKLNGYSRKMVKKISEQ